MPYYPKASSNQTFAPGDHRYHPDEWITVDCGKLFPTGVHGAVKLTRGSEDIYPRINTTCYRTAEWDALIFSTAAYISYLNKLREIFKDSSTNHTLQQTGKSNSITVLFTAGYSYCNELTEETKPRILNNSISWHHSAWSYISVWCPEILSRYTAH